MTSVFRQRASYRRSQRRLHATIQWTFDAAPPPAANPKRILSEVIRRRRRTEYRQPPRWEYERMTSTLRRGMASLGSPSLSGAGTISVLFDDAGIEPTCEFSVIGIEPTYTFSTGVNL